MTTTTTATGHTVHRLGASTVTVLRRMTDALDGTGTPYALTVHRHYGPDGLGTAEPTARRHASTVARRLGLTLTDATVGVHGGASGTVVLSATATPTADR